jgi:hypothetical protein
MNHPFHLLCGKAIAAAALCAATLLASSAAQAELIFTSAARSVSADTSLSLPDSKLSSTRSGLFNETALSQIFLDAVGNSSATASQNTRIDALAFSGRGEAALDLKEASTGFANTFIELFFTLTSSFSFNGDVRLVANGAAGPAASFVLEEVGGASILSGNDANPLAPFSGTLDAGDYVVRVLADGATNAPSLLSTSFASFDFRLAFVELADPPPPGVPEPASLALVLAGVWACGATRRRARR